MQDAKHLMDGIANDISGRPRRVPIGVDLITAGFPCKDFSEQNPTMKEHGENILKSLGNSGTVFNYCFQYANVSEGPFVFEENVPHALSESRFSDPDPESFGRQFLGVLRLQVRSSTYRPLGNEEDRWTIEPGSPGRSRRVPRCQASGANSAAP